MIVSETRPTRCVRSPANTDKGTIWARHPSPRRGRISTGALTAGLLTLVAVIGIVLWRIEIHRQQYLTATVEHLGGKLISHWRFDKQILLTGRPGWCIPGDSQVEGIDLMQCSDTTLDDQLAVLRTVPELRYLNLAYTQVSEAGLRHLVPLQSLERLDLSSTPITDAAVVQLLSLRALRSLDLDGTRITDASLRCLERMSNLECLNLRGNQVTRAGVARLQRQLPQTLIQSDFSQGT